MMQRKYKTLSLSEFVSIYRRANDDFAEILRIADLRDHQSRDQRSTLSKSLVDGVATIRIVETESK